MADQQEYQQQQVPSQQQHDVQPQQQLEQQPEQTDQQQSEVTPGGVVPPPQSPVGNRKPCNPCFMKLEPGAKIVAIIDIVLTLGPIIWLGFIIKIEIWNEWSKVGEIDTSEDEVINDDNSNTQYKLIFGIFISMMCFLIFEVVLAIVLLCSILLISYAKCRCFLFVKIIFNFIVFFLAAGSLFNKHGNIGITILMGVGGLWRIYAFIVVWAYYKEMKQDEEARVQRVNNRRRISSTLLLAVELQKQINIAKLTRKSPGWKNHPVRALDILVDLGY